MAADQSMRHREIPEDPFWRENIYFFEYFHGDMVPDWAQVTRPVGPDSWAQLVQLTVPWIPSGSWKWVGVPRSPGHLTKREAQRPKRWPEANVVLKFAKDDRNYRLGPARIDTLGDGFSLQVSKLL